MILTTNYSLLDELIDAWKNEKISLSKPVIFAFFTEKTTVEMLVLLVLNLYLFCRVSSEEVRYSIRLDNGLRLQGYMWKPKQETSIRALVFISHGYKALDIGMI